MGLSSKLVSSDGLDWSKTLLQDLPKPPVSRRQPLQNIPATEPLTCPRCDSTNTKFCYYNNYNKSQPRHFCKACKRHWTKGGTLRNVPVGGGRKNKRPKSAKTAATKFPLSNGNIINRVSPQMVIQAHQQQKSSSELIMSQPLITPPAPEFTAGNDQNSLFLGSNFHQNLHFPNSSSFQCPNVYDFSSGEAMEDSIVTSILPSTSSGLIMPQIFPNTSYWNWDDLDNFGPTDLNIPWDDSELKP